MDCWPVGATEIRTMSRRMLQHRYPKGKPAEANQPATASLPTPAADVMPQQWDGAFQQPTQYPMATAHLQQPQEEGCWSSVPASAASGSSSTADPAVHYGGPVSAEGYWNSHQPLGEEAVTGGGPAVPWSPPEGAAGGGQQQQQRPGATTSWEGGGQWAPAYAQWQWPGGAPAEGWPAAPGDVHWQQAGTQVDPVGHPSVHPEMGSLHHGLQESLAEDAVVPPAVDSQDCSSLGPVELQQEQWRHSEASGDDGTVSMFFQDGDHQPVPQVAQELSTSTGFVVDAPLDGGEDGMVAPPPPPGSDEPVNQEVLPEPMPLAAEPREVLPSPEEGGEVPPECSAPAPSKKAVIRARQGGAFKPPVRQGSTTDTALLQQQQQQNGAPPENLELLPPDGRPSLRRTGVAPLSPPGGPVDTVGLTLLDAPDMRALVTLAPAAPPIDRPSSPTGEATGRPPVTSEEEAAGDPARPLLRQSPLGREGEAARGGSSVVATRAATVLLASTSPLLSEDSALPERTEPSGSTDRPQPVLTGAAVEELESPAVVRSSALATSSHPLPPHHEPTSVGSASAHGKHEGPGDKGEPRTRQEEPRKGKPDTYREEQGKHARDCREPRESRPARARGSDDEAGDWKGSRDDFDRDGRRPAKGREDPERKRDRHYDRPDDRRAAGKADPEEYRKGGGRGGVTEDRKRRDYDYDYYEDRRGELRDDYRKGERRSERHAGRREPLRGHESDDEWRERRSDRRGDRYGGGRHDYRHDDRHSDRYSDRARPSSRVSQDGRGDRRRQDCRPASRRSESEDSSSPDSRKGYASGRQKRPGSAGGHNYSTYQRDYYNYYHRYGIAAGAVYGIPPGSGFGYGYHDELYRTNPAYKQQVDAYYGRLGGHPAHLTERHSVHSGRSSARDESFASNTEDDCDPSILDTESTRLDHVAPEPEEVKKFSRPHPLARFCGANGLLKLVPAVSSGSLPPPIELHSLKHLFQKDPQFHQLQAFPGPLIRSDTHKNDVIQFCTQKIESFSADPNLPDRSSHILLWELLVLMLRQNGFVSGSDIAELLLRGRGDPLSAPASRPGGEGGEVTSPEGADSSPSPDEGIVVTDRTQLGATGSSRALAKFREFLLFGHKKDALDWAVKSGLWGHALSLAAKMDTRTYAGIMTCFTNALAVNDPLQTLYQHLSGRQPAAVTCIADSKWGDWRPHLAMILSNPSSRPEVDARSITTLGDVLASRGCLPAAHFCYLMSQVEFGSYACKAAKLVLLGSNHQTLPFEEFASNEAVQCTEIYEYSQSLASPDYMLPHLQVYKFLHAMRLAEYGFAQKALHYCEVLADAMVRQGGGPAQLAAQTYELADRLKYHDPHFSQGQGELEELGDPAWLHTFAQLLSHQQQGGPARGPGQPQYGLEGHDVQPVAAETPRNESFRGQQSFASTGGFVAASTGFASPDSTFLPGSSAYLDSSPACGDGGAQGVAAPEQWNPARGREGGFPPVMSSTPFMTSSAEAGWNSQQAPPAPATAAEGSSFQSSPAVESMANGMPAQAPSSPPVSGQASSFDYYKASTYSHRKTTSRERVSSVSSSTDTRRDSVDSAGLTSSESRGAAKPAAKQPPVAGKSWLGGIFGKLLPKGPNQMILPDDKDPDIVWDEQKKCWVDKHAAPGELENQMAAPPSDSILAAKPSPISNKSGENRFQLNKQRSLRKHYVDVLNPGSGKASGDPPPVAAPFSAEQAPPQFFVPQPTVGAEPTPSYDFVSSVPPPEHATGPPKGSAHHQPGGEPLAAPVMYDPAEFTARPGDGHEGGSGYYGRRWSQAAYPT